MKKALGIDIGGTKIAFSLVDKNGNLLTNVEKIATPDTIDDIKEAIANIINFYEKDVEFIALATAGTVNNENTKIIGSTANMPKGYKDIDFQQLSNKKVFIENDANSAAYAEYKIGASKGYENNVMLTLGTGVGGGIIINGKLFKGKSGAAGEMHFMMSRKQERQCTCGAYDCFEAYASGNGLRKTGIETTKNPDVTTYDIINGVKEDVDTCKKALEIWQNDIALGILGLNNIFDTGCFVLSGSMEKFVDTKKIETFVNKNTVTTPTKVFHAKAGNYAGLIGVALLGYDTIK